MALRPDIPLLPHQARVGKKIVANGGTGLLAWHVGAGKTAGAMKAHHAMKDAGMGGTSLIVVPAKLRRNFAADIEKFTDDKHVIYGNREEQDSGLYPSIDGEPQKADHHLVSYDLFRQDPHKWIEKIKPDTLILDEVHRLKNEHGVTHEAIKTIRPKVKNAIGLSASSFGNSPADVVGILNALVPTETPGWFFPKKREDFERKFLEPVRGGFEIKNKEELTQLLSKFMDYYGPGSPGYGQGGVVPHKDVQEVLVEMSPKQEQLMRYVFDQLPPLVKWKMEKNVEGLSDKEIRHVFSKITAARQVSNSIHTLDPAISPMQAARETPKIKKVLDDVEDHLKETEDGQAILISHLVHGGADVLHAGLEDRKIPHGMFLGAGRLGLKEEEAHQAIKDFNERKKKVIIISPAGAEGLNLPDTTFIGAIDGHFNPERINQLEARGVRTGGQAHRPPDQRKVIVRRYLTVAPGGLGRMLSNFAKRLVPFGLAGSPDNTRSVDRWIYDSAKMKDRANTQVRDSLAKQGGSLSWVMNELSGVPAMAYRHVNPDLDQAAHLGKVPSPLPARQSQGGGLDVSSLSLLTPLSYMVPPAVGVALPYVGIAAGEAGKALGSALPTSVEKGWRTEQLEQGAAPMKPIVGPPSVGPSPVKSQEQVVPPPPGTKFEPLPGFADSLDLKPGPTRLDVALKKTSELNGAEAVWGLMGWLTSRDKPVTLSARDDVTEAVDLAARFCETNKLKTRDDGELRPGDSWSKELKHPKKTEDDEWVERDSDEAAKKIADAVSVTLKVKDPRSRGAFEYLRSTLGMALPMKSQKTDTEPHFTLAYAQMKPEDIERALPKLKDAISKMNIRPHVGEIGSFEGPENHVVHLKSHDPELRDAHKALRSIIQEHGGRFSFRSFKPHMSIGRMDDAPRAEDLARLNQHLQSSLPIEDTEITISRKKRKGGEWEKISGSIKLGYPIAAIREEFWNRFGDKLNRDLAKGGRPTHEERNFLSMLHHGARGDLDLEDDLGNLIGTVFPKFIDFVSVKKDEVKAILDRLSPEDRALVGKMDPEEALHHARGTFKSAKAESRTWSVRWGNGHQVTFFASRGAAEKFIQTAAEHYGGSENMEKEPVLRMMEPGAKEPSADGQYHCDGWNGKCKNPIHQEKTAGGVEALLENPVSKAIAPWSDTRKMVGEEHGTSIFGTPFRVQYLNPAVPALQGAKADWFSPEAAQLAKTYVDEGKDVMRGLKYVGQMTEKPPEKDLGWSAPFDFFAADLLRDTGQKPPPAPVVLPPPISFSKDPKLLP